MDALSASVSAGPPFCCQPTEVTGCEWVNEYSAQWSLYRCWSEEERDAHAREIADDLAADRAEADGISLDEAFEAEYQAAYDMHPVTISGWQVAAWR